MAGDAPSAAEYERRISGLEALVAQQSAVIEAQREVIARLESRVAELERQLGQNSGNSGLPSSRDPATERKRQAEERERRKQSQGAKRRRPGKQTGSAGAGPEMSATPDEVIDHRPVECGGCGADLDVRPDAGFQARQIVELPKVTPVVTEHRAHARQCSCGHVTAASFPEGVRAPVSYGPRVRATVAYLLGRQHLPTRRVAEAMADLFGLGISTGAVDAIYSDASRRLRDFVAALVSLLRTLPVLHADETTDRVGTKTCWMHVVSTAMFTLIHASVTRGSDAIDEAGVLRGYRGVVVHDRLAMYWKLKAKHGLCGAHLLRDLADVAVVATQTAWAAGLAALLVEINAACDDARRRGLRQLGPAHQRGFAARYDALVAQGLAANPDPVQGRKRDYYQRRSHNLVTAFSEHRRHVLRYMYDLDVAFTNNQAERDLRPTKLHRKISGSFRSQHGAERFAHLRSYLSTTRKHDVPAIDALVRLFRGDPWMPPPPLAT
ncbi:MAG: IS66 family transposase [Actinobacteria bacterium]|nr:IS66 family transposase [Actinomycetota bacterium]